MMRNVILTTYCAILIFVANMFVIAVAAVTAIEWLATAALLVFLSGVGALMGSVLLTALEVRISNRAIEYEVRRVLALGR